MSSRRARGRGNSRGGRQQNIRNQQMDSNGPAGRIRGTPQQVLDRYLTLARDASPSGDSVHVENLLQHAEHYTRLLNASAPPQQQNQQHQANGRDDQSDSYDDGNDDSDSAGGGRDNQNDRPARSADSRSGDSRSGDNRSGDNRSGDNRQAESRAGDGDDTNADPQADAASPPSSGATEQPDGPPDQPPPRRRRRSRVQRQADQDQTGGETAEASNGSGASGDENPVPPIDLSSAAEQPASEPPRERTEVPTA